MLGSLHYLIYIYPTIEQQAVITRNLRIPSTWSSTRYWWWSTQRVNLDYSTSPLHPENRSDMNHECDINVWNVTVGRRRGIHLTHCQPLYKSELPSHCFVFKIHLKPYHPTSIDQKMFILWLLRSSLEIHFWSFIIMYRFRVLISMHSHIPMSISR